MNGFILRTLISCIIISYGIPGLPALARSKVSTAPQPAFSQLKNKELKSTQFSIHFYNLTQNRVILSHNGDIPLIPASNMKIVTTAAALDRFGKEFTFDTVAGLLGNDLVIVGFGDPLLGDPVVAQQEGKTIFSFFEEIVFRLKTLTMTEISGDLIVDDTFFDDVRFHPNWPADQADKWYAAQISAVNFNDNCLDITVSPAGSGKLASYSLMPDTRYVTITNQCTGGASKQSQVGALRPFGANQITLRGKCGVESLINVTVDRPSAYMGFVLAEYLANNGIPIRGKLILRAVRSPEGQFPPHWVELARHQTPIEKVLRRCNTRSLNLAAECLIKTLGARLENPHGIASQGSWENGRKAMEQFLQKIGISFSQYKIDDGSGLSKENRISAKAITAILARFYNSPDWLLYRNTFATPEEGTLEKAGRFEKVKGQDRLFAKTGYVLGVRALSGYLQTPQGDWIAFSILSNQSNWYAKKFIDDLVMEYLE